ncbi:MAG TPA: FAD-dependent oxidoreductase [Thermoanaerobaculia bacterium]|nr:FAD-dependent oxidoreductase [Thermoanaerobaculia bacterium]
MSAVAHGTAFALASSVKPSRPLILLIEPHEEHLGLGREFLLADCSETFEVRTAQSIEAARTTLDGAAEQKQPVVLLLVRHILEEDQLRELLRRAKEVSPGVKVILYGDDLQPAFAVDAKREGLVDYNIAEPWQAPETTLEPIVRDALRAWESTSTFADVVQIVGDQWLPRCHDVKDLLARHRVPYRWVDTSANDDDGPLAEATRVIFPDGAELVDPNDEDIAQKLGFSTSPDEDFYDLVIVGGGPAGLAAAVYASSEGLRTVIIERDVPGGQAGSSSLIENYLGFPDGLSGAELASRAVTQAQKFGTEILLTRTATELRDDRGYRVIRLDDDTEIVSHTVLLSMGVAYRRFTAEGAERLTGSGVYYGAAAAEAARFRDGDVCLLGSGNSAAQAALLLARYARQLTIITIDPTLETTMSHYLVERIRALPNVKLMTGTSVAEVKGEERVESILIEDLDTKERRELSTDALFVWIGAKPHTDWLSGAVARDKQGFVLTGRDLRRPQLKGWDADRWPSHLESSIQGVFVAGDVRHGSVKRVGSAVGEGAMAVQLIHEYLRER